MSKLDLGKAEEPEVKLPTSAGSSKKQERKKRKKQESSRKTPTSALLTMPKPLTMWITINWKILKDGNTRPSDLPLEKPVTWNNRLVPNRKRSMSRLYVVTLLI